MYVPTFILWIAMILISLLIIVAAGVLHALIKARREIEGKYNDLMTDRHTLLTALWCMQCNLPLASWREYVRGLHGNLIPIVEFGDQSAAERALGIMICSADISTVRRLRDGIESKQLLRLLFAITPMIKEYHNADRREPGWPDDDAIHGVIAVIRGMRPVLAIADPCTTHDIAGGKAWLNSKE